MKPQPTDKADEWNLSRKIEDFPLGPSMLYTEDVKKFIKNVKESFYRAFMRCEFGGLNITFAQQIDKANSIIDTLAGDKLT